MSLTIKTLWGLLLFSFVVGAIALSKWGIPAPTTQVVKVIPNNTYIEDK